MAVILAFLSGVHPVLRNQGVVKVDPDILGGQHVLKNGNVQMVNAAAAVDGQHRSAAGGLSGENRRRNHPDNIPGVTFCGCGPARCNQIVETGADPGSVTISRDSFGRSLIFRKSSR